MGINLAKLSGGTTIVPSERLDALKARVRGAVLTEHDEIVRRCSQCLERHDPPAARYYRAVRRRGRCGGRRRFHARSGGAAFGSRRRAQQRRLRWWGNDRLSAMSSATRVAIYARVSTDNKGQDPENQLRQLRAWCACRGTGWPPNMSSTRAAARVPSSAGNMHGSLPTRRGATSTWCWCGRSTGSPATAWRRPSWTCSASRPMV